MEDHSPIARALAELEDLTGKRYPEAWAQLKAAEGLLNATVMSSSFLSSRRLQMVVADYEKAASA